MAISRQSTTGGFGSVVNGSMSRRTLLKSGAVSVASGAAFALAGSGMAGRAGAASKSLRTISMMLDFYPNADDVFVDLSDKYGYFAEVGLKVNFVNPPSTLNEIPTLVGLGHFDVGISVVPDTLLARLNGASVLSVAGWAKRSDGLIFYPKNKIRSPKDLVGKTVAVYDSVDYKGFLMSYMKSAGLSSSQVDTQNVDYTPPLIAAGKVYAGEGLKWGEGVATEELTHKQPGFISFFDPRYGVPQMNGNVLVVSEAFANANGALLKSLVTAMMRGMKKSLTDAKATKAAMGPWASTGPNAQGTLASNMAQFDGLRSYSFFGSNQNPNTATYAQQSISSWDAVNSWLKGLGLVKKSVKASDYVTNEFVTAAARNPKI